MHVLDERQAVVVRAVCERIVPGCARTGGEVYVDALLARMPPPAREQALAAFEKLAAPAAASTAELGEYTLTPEFQMVRALACEAFYSDFVAPGADGPGGWQEIDFAPPLAARLNKDWSYLGITG